MQAIILAAGMGTRLGTETPKPLIEINGKPLLIRLIEQLKDEGTQRIVVVTGHQNLWVEEAVAALHVHTAFNPIYRISDNLVSFWVGQSLITEQCIMSHGDLIVQDELLRRLFQAEGDVVLPMDRSSVDDESMKIRLLDGQIADLSKVMPSREASGESIPIMKFSAGALKELKKLTVRAVKESDFGRFIDDAVLRLIKTREFYSTALDVTGLRWVEIDTESDLVRAHSLFGRSPW